MGIPLDPIIKQLQDLLKLTEEGLKNPSPNQKVPPELWERLRALESLVIAYVQLQQRINAEEANQLQLQKEPSQKDKAALEKLALVKEAIIKQKEMLNQAAAAIKKQTTPEEKKQRDITKRKGKFRGVGEKDRWKKL